MLKEASILIVTHNRKKELEKTLVFLKETLDLAKTEVLVFLDGCSDGSDALKKLFAWVDWHYSPHKLGASRARHLLYKHAKGAIFFGFDDDAHPITPRFIQTTQQIFKEHPLTGVIAFQEIRGFPDEMIKEMPEDKTLTTFPCSEFIGCGFAIKKDVYTKTRGFPDWIDIYGEEACLSAEVIQLGFEIQCTNRVKVHHRVNKVNRKRKGGNYFRFEKQLKNVTLYYLVYYPFLLRLRKIAKLYFHNFTKYGLTDIRYMKGIGKAVMGVLVRYPLVLSRRKVLEPNIIKKLKTLPMPVIES